MLLVFVISVYKIHVLLNCIVNSNILFFLKKNKKNANMLHYKNN